MSIKSNRKNVRQSDFKVVARGVHRAKPDFPRLMQATLDHYMAMKDAEQQGAQQRPANRCVEGACDDVS